MSPQEAHPTRDRAARAPALSICQSRVCQVECRADLPALLCALFSEPPQVAAVAATCGEIEREAARGALDLVGGLGAVPRAATTESRARTRSSDVMGNEHGAPNATRSAMPRTSARSRRACPAR